MTDRERLERAARAAGIALDWEEVPVPGSERTVWRARRKDTGEIFNPYRNKLDAFQLMSDLRIDISHEGTFVAAMAQGGQRQVASTNQSTRDNAICLAIVLAASGIETEADI
jgi:hypothetical protein